MHGIPLDAPAETVDVDIHGAWVHLRQGPHVSENLRAVEDAVCRPYKEAEQLKLAAHEVDGATVGPHLVGVEVDPEAPLLIDAPRGLLAGAPRCARVRRPLTES